jgi:hypothetical protein
MPEGVLVKLMLVVLSSQGPMQIGRLGESFLIFISLALFICFSFSCLSILFYSLFLRLLLLLYYRRQHAAPAAVGQQPRFTWFC